MTIVHGHCMIDIEGYAPGGMIASIGAVVFDPNGDYLGPEFYINIDPVSYKRYGMYPDPDVLLWWFSQPKEVQQAVLNNPKPMDVKRALNEFIRWWQKNDLKFQWSHQYDSQAFRCLFNKTHNGYMPWRGKDVRDLGTVLAMKGFNWEKIERQGTHHHALDDAKHQARKVQMVCRKANVRY